MSHTTKTIEDIRCDECGAELDELGANIPKESAFARHLKRLLGMGETRSYSLYIKIYLDGGADVADLCYFCAANIVKKHAEEMMADMLEARQ